MNDPWTTLVQRLSGAQAVSPQAWPVRRIHRTLDDPDPVEPPRAASVPRQRSKREPQPEAKPAARIRCTCTNCVASARTN